MPNTNILNEDPKKIEQDLLAYKLHGITINYPALSPSIDPLVRSLRIGKRANYKRISKLIKRAVIKNAKKFRYEPLIPKLEKIAESIEQLSDKKREYKTNFASIGKFSIFNLKFPTVSFIPLSKPSMMNGSVLLITLLLSRIFSLIFSIWVGILVIGVFKSPDASNKSAFALTYS